MIDLELYSIERLEIETWGGVIYEGKCFLPTPTNSV
jgi:hypothetical protein